MSLLLFGGGFVPEDVPGLLIKYLRTQSAPDILDTGPTPTIDGRVIQWGDETFGIAAEQTTNSERLFVTFEREITATGGQRMTSKADITYGLFASWVIYRADDDTSICTFSITGGGITLNFNASQQARMLVVDSGLRSEYRIPDADATANDGTYHLFKQVWRTGFHAGHEGHLDGTQRSLTSIISQEPGAGPFTNPWTIGDTGGQGQPWDGGLAGGLFYSPVPSADDELRIDDFMLDQTVKANAL